MAHHVKPVRERVQVHKERIQGPNEGKWQADPDAIRRLLEAFGYPVAAVAVPVLTKIKEWD